MADSFSALAGIPPSTLGGGGDPDFQQAHNNSANVATLNYENGQQQADQNAAPPVTKITQNFDESGNSTYDFHGVSERTKEWLTTMAGLGVQTKQAFDEAAATVHAKRQFLEQNPIIGSLGRIASNAAASYSAPGSGLQGIVRGAGAYGLGVFGQSPQELATEEAGLRSHEIGALAPISNELIANDRSERLIGIDQQRQKRFEAREHDRQVAEGDTAVQRIVSDARLSGSYTPGAAYQSALAHGMDPQMANNYESRAQEAYLAYNRKQAEAKEQKASEFDHEMKIRQQYALSTKEAELKLAEKYGQDPKTATKLGGLLKITDQYESALKARTDGVQAASDVYNAFNAVGGKMFQVRDMPVETMFDRVMGALGSDSIDLKDGTSKKTKEVIADYLQVDPADLKASDIIKFRNGLSKARSDYRSFSQVGPQLESQHEFLKNSLPASVRDGVLSLKSQPSNAAAPTAATGAAPTAAPTQPQSTQKPTHVSGSGAYVSYDGGKTWVPNPYKR